MRHNGNASLLVGAYRLTNGTFRGGYKNQKLEGRNHQIRGSLRIHPQNTTVGFLAELGSLLYEKKMSHAPKSLSETIDTHFFEGRQFSPRFWEGVSFLSGTWKFQWIFRENKVDDRRRFWKLPRGTATEVQWFSDAWGTFSPSPRHFGPRQPVFSPR